MSPAEIVCERQDGKPVLLELLARTGLRLVDGVVLGKEAHREFMNQSGLQQDLQASLRSGGEDAASIALRMRLSHRSSPVEGELNRQICDALIGLGAPSVTLVSKGPIKRQLKSIPEVKHVVREAWLSVEGLKRQLEAVSRGEEIPTWAVSIPAEGV